MYWKIVIFTLFSTAALAGIFSMLNHYLNLPDDNPLEEVVEKVIEEKTNQSIDLTPQSKENNV